MISQSLAFLGTLSYSMYVFHWEFVNEPHYYRWLPQLSKNLPTNAVLSVLLVVSVFCWLTFMVIERPFFELRKPYLKKPPAS